jgi:hypothetical protein
LFDETGCRLLFLAKSFEKKTFGIPTKFQTTDNLFIEVFNYLYLLIFMKPPTEKTAFLFLHFEM